MALPGAAREGIAVQVPANGLQCTHRSHHLLTGGNYRGPLNNCSILVLFPITTVYIELYSRIETYNCIIIRIVNMYS